MNENKEAVPPLGKAYTKALVLAFVVFEKEVALAREKYSKATTRALEAYRKAAKAPNRRTCSINLRMDEKRKVEAP